MADRRTAGLVPSGLLLAGLLVLPVLLSVRGAAADPPAAERKPHILIRVLTVHAKAEPGRVDWVTESLQKQLAPMNFGTLRVVDRQQFKLRFGERGQVGLPAGHRLEFLPISVLGRELHMQVEMPGVLNTRLRMTSGRGVMIGGVPHDDGFLIVHLTPTFRTPRGAKPGARPRRKRGERPALPAEPARISAQP